MRGRYIQISKVVFLLILSIDIGLLYANENWDEYDEQWNKRDPAVRLEILNRSIKHFTKAVDYYKRGDFNAAERFAHDALKVVPQFAEAHFLLAEIYDTKGKIKKAERYRGKGDRFSSFPSILKERDYLINNLERLKEQYTPSFALNRIVFFLLFIAGYCIIIFLIMTSGILTNIAMKIRGVARIVKEKKEEEPHIVVGEFVGEDKEKRLSWYWKLFIYTMPFVFCFCVSILFGAQSIKDIIIFTFFPGLFITVVIYKLFFSDDDFGPPQRFPGMR